MSRIDFVITWVDGNDPEWQAEKAKYDGKLSGDKRANRFRDWDNLQYWFRGVETYAPWVNKVHFITWGHLPYWLNKEHPKLHVVNHKDYIPEEYLPTFSSRTIELNIHRIPDLSDRFVLFNDDMFLTNELFERDYFSDGLPCDSALETVQSFVKGGIDHAVAFNLEIINGHFVKSETVNSFYSSWYSFKYGKGLFKNLYLKPFKRFVGFENPHLPIAYLKSTFEKVWQKEPEVLQQASQHKFRNQMDVNQWLMRYWQLVSGRFHPIVPQLGRFFSIGRDNAEIAQAIRNQAYKVICLSDDDMSLDFETEKKRLQELFKMILPNKSAFER